MDMRPGALLGPFLLRGEAIWPAALQLTVRTMLSTRPAARDTATSRFSVSAIAIDSSSTTPAALPARPAVADNAVASVMEANADDTAAQTVRRRNTCLSRAEHEADRFKELDRQSCFRKICRTKPARP